MKNIINIVGLSLVIVVSSGCVAMNSGNYAHKDLSLPFKPGELAVTTTTMTNIVDGKTNIMAGQVTQTGPAVNKDIKIQQLNGARDAAVSKEIGGKGFLASLFSGNTNYYGNGSYYNNGPGGVNTISVQGGGGYGWGHNNGPGGGNTISSIPGGTSNVHNGPGGQNVVVSSW